MTETTTEDNVWYLARDGKQHGPLSHLEMTKLVELGHLRTADLVWRPGFENWRPAPSVFELTPPIPTPIPPAPPAAPTKPEPAPAPATRTQPSFADLSGPVEPARPEPARFEFQPNVAARIDASLGDAAFATPVAREPEPAPAAFDARPFRSAGTASQFGSPSTATADAPTPEPFRMEPIFEEPAPKKGRGLAVALGLLVAIAGLSAAGYTYRDVIKATLQSATSAPADLPVVEAPAAANGREPPAAQAVAPPPPAPAPAVPAAAVIQPIDSGPVVTTTAMIPPAPATLPGVPVTADPSAIEAAWQPSPFWSLAKTEFPQWYADRVREVGDMKAANKPEEEINLKLVEAIVVLRRQNASKALAASPDRLKSIAEAFVANLTAMQSQSVDACYDFIGKGELTPAAAALVQKPSEGAPLHAQLGAVLTAVVEGQKNPVSRTAPQTTDYNLLATELGKIGWSQADIQLFADPKALSAAPRDRVCKMVKDWFTAHLAVNDDAARERLLFETLRLVIAG